MFMSNTSSITLFRLIIILLSIIMASQSIAGEAEQTEQYGLGRVATNKEILKWDIDVSPNGDGLPLGHGTAEEGEAIYKKICASCHGKTGIEGPMPKLVGGHNTLTTDHPLKTVGSYWPFATTLFDYIYRAMPPTAPQSLTSNEVYALVAWILARNKIIDRSSTLNAESLQKIEMPNRNGFYSRSPTGYIEDHKMKLSTIVLVSALTFTGVVCATQTPSHALESSGNAEPSIAGLGQIEFHTSGKPEAQPWFLRGVLLLHNFQYDDAREAFQHAQKLDESFAMAYWGEAMTANHPLWGEQYLKQGRATLHRLAPTPQARLGKASTKREQGYLQAVEALYGEGDKQERDDAYREAMRGLMMNFPNDQEAATFYALAILGSAQGERDMATYMRAAAIAEEVFHKNPKHPGAVHYLIHSYDDPIHAPLGLRAARVYASLAPAASHAQHMPSHIFMALGMWHEVISANTAAWVSSEARIKQKGLTISSRPYHTLKWLMYAYLQTSDIQEARRLLTIIEEDVQQTQSRYARGYRAAMRAMYIIEAQAWNTHYLQEDRAGLRFTSAASELFAAGMSAVKMHNLPIAKQALGQLSKRIDPQHSESLSQDGVAGLSMMKELEGLILLEESKQQEAVTALQEAAALEDSLPYDYGPPIPIKPTHELLGEVFLKLGHAEKAKKEFEHALKRAPKRRLALEGLALSMRRGNGG